MQAEEAQDVLSKRSDRMNDAVMQSESQYSLSQTTELSSAILDFQRQSQSFGKFVSLTFEVFPLRLSAIEKVIKLIFSDNGVFKCIEEAYETSPVTVTDVLAVRAKQFLPHAELVALKGQVFTRSLVKLEDVSRRVKSILDRHRSAKSRQEAKDVKMVRRFSHDLSEKSNHSSTPTLEAEITDKVEKILLLTIATFQLSESAETSISADYILKNQRNLQAFICNSGKGQPDFVLKNKKWQVGLYLKRCMAGLVCAFKDQCQTQAEAIYRQTVVRKLPTYLKRIAVSYPGYRANIIDAAIKHFPHKDRLDIVTILVYSKFVAKLATMLQSCCPDAEGKVFRVIIDTLASLDVECDFRARKGTKHFVKMNVH